MKVACVLAACFALLSFCPSEAMVLEGFAQHDEWVNQSQLASTADKATNHPSWYRIPGWLAGTWQRSEEEQLLSVDYTDGTIDRNPQKIRVKSRFTYGLQQDAEGDIWQCTAVPVAAQSLRVENKAAIYEQTASCIRNANEDSITVESQGREFRTTGDGFRTFSWQQQTVSTISRLPGDKALITGTIRCYDYKGNLLSVSNNRAVITRIAPFHQIAGENLRLLFETFLKENGHAELIPNRQVARLD